MDEEMKEEKENSLPKGGKKNEKINRKGIADKIWQEYEDGLTYQKQMGFSENFPNFERFKQGDQWPRATERTKSLPRPVFNVVRLFVSNKKSNVLSQNIDMVYSPIENDEMLNEFALQGAADYTDYAKNLWYELDQDNLNDDIVEDAATNGSGIVHYYWDKSIKGTGEIPFVGALRGETIDALNIFFGNPQVTDIQKQPWIIISSREQWRDVVEMAKEEGLSKLEIDLIRPDDDTTDEGYDAAQYELDGSKKVTVLTKYFKDNTGEVFFSKVVHNVAIIDKRSLTPKPYNVTDQSTDSLLGGEYTVYPKKITLYPIVIFQWNKRKKCIFGNGEVEAIIPNQKAINFNIAMMLLSVQDNAWPKMLVKPGALRQTVTNKPGEILTDYFSSGDGVKFMQPPNFNYMAINLVDKILDLSRTTSGVTEVATGESLGANMSASAIIALQNQAKVPIDNIQKRFYRSIKEIGKIWESFFKTYYNTPRNIVTEDMNGNNITRTFNGEDYAGIEFKLKIDVGAGSTYSEALSIATLDKLYDTQAITLDQYIDLVPETVMPFKGRLKKMREGIVQQQEMINQMGNVQGNMQTSPQQGILGNADNMVNAQLLDPLEQQGGGVLSAVQQMQG